MISKIMAKYHIKFLNIQGFWSSKNDVKQLYDN